MKYQGPSGTRTQGAEGLGSLSHQPALTQDLQSKGSRETGDRQALLEQDRDLRGHQAGCWWTDGQTGPPRQGDGKVGPAGRSPGREDGSHSTTAELGTQTVRLAWVCV